MTFADIVKAHQGKKLTPPDGGFSDYEVEQALEAVASELGYIMSNTKGRKVTGQEIQAVFIEAVNHVLSNLSKNSLQKRHRQWTLLSLGHALQCICDDKYAAPWRQRRNIELGLDTGSLFAILSGITSKHRAEMLLVLLEDMIPDRKDASISEHEAISLLEKFMLLGLTQEQIRDSALMKGHIPLLSVGLLTKDFFAGVEANPAYPQATLEFLQANNLLEAKPFLEWQTAVEGDHAEFKSSYAPTPEEIEKLLVQAVENRSSNLWDWFAALTPNPLSASSSDTVWKHFLEEATRCQAPAKLKAKFFQMLDRCQVSDEIVRRGLKNLILTSPSDKASDLALRLGFLRIGGKAMAELMPEEALPCLARMVTKGDRAGQAAHLIANIILLQPSMSRTALKPLADPKLHGTTVAWRQENHQLLFTLLGTQNK